MFINDDDDEKPEKLLNLKISRKFSFYRDWLRLEKQYRAKFTKSSLFINTLLNQPVSGKTVIDILLLTVKKPRLTGII